MEKICSKCGSYLNSDETFCGMCGADVERADNIPNKKSSKTRTVIISSIVVVVLYAIIMGVLALSLTEKKPEKVEMVEQKIEETQIGETKEKTNTVVVEEFCDNVCGVWMLLEADNPHASVSFITITSDMHMTGGVYPGTYGRTCEITKIEHKTGSSFNAILYYPATEKTEMDDAMPELKKEATFNSPDGYCESLEITYKDGTISKFVFVEDEFEQAAVKFEQIIEEKQQSKIDAGIPKISASSTMLDADFETIKIRTGYDLSGPDDDWYTMAQSIFYLANMPDVDCYMNVSSSDEVIGVKNGEIVFYGNTGLNVSPQVKDYLPDNALTTKPAIYTIRENSAVKGGLDSYVWKLKNGYMAIIVSPSTNVKFYNQYVFNIVYVADLSYLSYIGS